MLRGHAAKQAQPGRRETPVPLVKGEKQERLVHRDPQDRRGCKARRDRKVIMVKQAQLGRKGLQVKQARRVQRARPVLQATQARKVPQARPGLQVKQERKVPRAQPGLQDLKD